LTNKELIAGAFAALAKGDGALLVGLMADDVVWTVMGMRTWSGRLEGKMAVLTQLLGPLGAKLTGPVHVEARRIIAEGDMVVVEARGFDNVTREGKSYNNNYCFVMRLADGKICEIVEYLDNMLVADSLGMI
jgi:ketosteroid isomerase-like protein